MLERLEPQQFQRKEGARQPSPEEQELMLRNEIQLEVISRMIGKDSKQFDDEDWKRWDRIATKFEAHWNNEKERGLFIDLHNEAKKNAEDKEAFYRKIAEEIEKNDKEEPKN